MSSIGTSDHVQKVYFDWDKCIFCQKTQKSLKLTCPAHSKRSDVGSGYKSLAEKIKQFQEYGLPPEVNLRILDEGDGVEATCSRHKACWHKTCIGRVLHTTTLSRLSVPANDSSQPLPLSDSDSPPRKRTTRHASGSVSVAYTDVCFFCENTGSDLRQVMTQKVDSRVRECAALLGDTMLQGKLLTGDMIATEAKYHPGCLLALYEQASRKQNTTDTGEQAHPRNPNIEPESLALAEVIAYIEDCKLVERTPSVFKLSDLINMYSSNLERYSGSPIAKVHSTRFKDRLLESCPYLTAAVHGRDVLVTFDEHVGHALHRLTEHADAEAVHMMHVVKLLRDAIFSASFHFEGSFESNCQIESIPKMLLNFVNMLLEGPGCINSSTNQAALSISQLIVFNAIQRQRPHVASVDVDDTAHKRFSTRHSSSQETPLPIYIGLMLHSATRKKKVVNKCNRLGLSVSYNRVLQIMNKTANVVCKEYRDQNLVCPPSLHNGVFTVAAADNIDHNMSSATAQSAFHGTAISLIQLPTDKKSVNKHIFDFDAASDKTSDILLPECYSNVMPCILHSDNKIPQADFTLSDTSNIANSEYDWLRNVHDGLSNEEHHIMSWAAFHATNEYASSRIPAVTALLPMFRESSNTAAMIKHCLTVVKSAIAKLNPGQIPIVTFDQPLFALAKQIQWQWPNLFGEDKCLVMMGGLHIEMAALRMLGHWLDGSGWTYCLVQSGISTAGVADSFLRAADIKRSRYAHSVTAAALYECLQRSYAAYCSQGDSVASSHNGAAANSFDDWRVNECAASVQFRFWNTVLELELLVLTFIRSLRDADFMLYAKSLQDLLPWFFALDQTNYRYSRWLSVHVRDMLLLEKLHPDVNEKFVAGCFTAAKTTRKFSSIAFDQVHEQLNAIIKGDGGVIGLTASDAGLGRWTMAGPEIVRMTCEFEADAKVSESSEQFQHHEESPAFQRRFEADVRRLTEVLLEDNPFVASSSNDLMVLGSRILADITVSDSILHAEQIGRDQMEEFFSDRIKGTISIFTPLPRNKLHMFGYSPATKRKPSSSLKMSELKTDCELFSRLYIACQSRDGDLDEFFKHENQPYPPSLSQHGKLRIGSKSDLLSCLTHLNSSDLPDLAALAVDAYVLDGAVIVQMLSPGTSKTFADYRDNIFIPHIRSYLKRSTRVDVVFDVYSPSSLKAGCREKRGTGLRTRVLANTKLPSNWHQFLLVDENKQELFHFLADVSIACDANLVLVTDGESARCLAGQINLNDVSPCTQEEADTRIVLHCCHASKHGAKRIAIRTVDTDVVILAISFFHELMLTELWIHFGVGKHVRLIPIHSLAGQLGPAKCKALLLFHAITGCDTVSCFFGRGKKSAWEAWNLYPEVTDAFTTLLLSETEIQDKIAILERFIIIMYDRTSECTNLDAARKHLFTKKSKLLESLPPTSDAFMQHVKRAVYQARICWSQCLEKNPVQPDPSDWGWVQDGSTWSPFWASLPEISQTSRELLHCACKKGCTARCKCVRANLQCTALCQCDGECTRP